MKQVGGFTLLEVLAASLILFVAIALASMAYQTGIKSEQSAQKKVVLAVALSYIRQSIEEEIRIQPDASNGEGQWDNFLYTWEVTNRLSKWSKAGIDSESQSRVELGHQLELTTIRVTVNGEEHEFTSLSWR